MKILIIPAFVFILYSCNQSPLSNQNVNGVAPGISVFTPSNNENPDNLKHIKQALVVSPFLPNYEQVASGTPVVVEVTLTIEEKKLEIAPGVEIWA